LDNWIEVKNPAAPAVKRESGPGDRAEPFPDAPTNVRYWGQSRHRSEMAECPLLTQSGHERLWIFAVEIDH
jgi:hypothetical protein